MKYKELGLSWNFRYLEKEFQDNWISYDATSLLEKVLEKYPNCESDKIFGLHGNLVKGNILFNEITDILLDGGRIRSKCLRLNILEPLDDFNFVSKIDLILVDNIDTEYMSRQSLEQLLRLQDYIEPFCNLIFYNISKKNAQLPKIFKDILELSNNIQFK